MLCSVLSIDNNGSHLSSAYVPGVVLSTLPAFCVIILYVPYVSTLSSPLQNKTKQNTITTFFVILAFLKSYWMWITRSLLQMRNLSLGEAQPFVPVHTAGLEGKGDSNQDPSICFFYGIVHRLRPILHRKGGRQFLILIICAWRFLDRAEWAGLAKINEHNQQTTRVAFPSPHWR